MLVQTHFPRSLSRARYDQYLASGWFRGSVMLYKMDLLCIDERLFSVVNIRMNLDHYAPTARQHKTMPTSLKLGPAELADAKTSTRCQRCR